ncbi:MAG: Rne/Rng family ribonuclease [Alphaproteobacteria bacterium]
MAKRMLIDAMHAEETRVAVVDGNRLEEYDYESTFRKPLKGNIFLAKVTRVEPSLQACFVNYGGNRHGFLPFSEIHPDYFRIPISDREALIEAQRQEMEARLAAEEAEDEAEFAENQSDDEDISDDTPPEEVTTLEGGQEVIEEDADADEATETAKKDKAAEAEEKETKKKPRRGRRSRKKDAQEENSQDEETADSTPSEKESIGNTVNDAEELSDDELDQEVNGNVASDDEENEDGNDNKRRGRGRGRGRYNNRGRGRGRGRYNNNNKRMASNARRVEVVGGDGIEGDQIQRPSLKKNYKIQEVIKRGQIMLIQVSKEERGNKGAAVTTYLSLPGRYSVLMPNSPRAGGVSRKIANYKERKRMREILSDLQVPEGMSVIMRTAGTSRTKTEIKRDLDYLIRLWNKIRETTLESTAPELIYEEGSLMKRSIRDIYTRDIEEVLVAGVEGYKETKNFMKMLIPSHAKRVQEYKDGNIPLFTRYQIEGQINEIGTPTVKLRSGGSLVIHPTEALVSIDVNSGRATKERHIEETALKTNLEAAEEVARQLRLRDLGGLVVIDFIDMENYRNNHKVERKMRESLSGDRARIQIGRISNFGLMELSRQRLNPSLAEAQYEPCSHCNGTGTVHTVDAAAIQALRALEEEGTLKRSSRIVLNVSPKVALYILNNKRDLLADIESRYSFKCFIQVDDNMPARQYTIEPIKEAEGEELPTRTRETDDSTPEATEEDDNNKKRGRNRRNNRNRRGRGGRDERDTKSDSEDENDNAENVTTESNDSDSDDQPKKPRSRRGRNNRRDQRAKKDADNKETDDSTENTSASAEPSAETPVEEKPVKAKEKAEEEAKAKPETKKKPAKAKTPRAKKAKKEDKEKADSKDTASTEVPVAPSNDDVPEQKSEAHKEHETVNQEPKSKKRGWWSKS